MRDSYSKGKVATFDRVPPSQVKPAASPFKTKWFSPDYVPPAPYCPREAKNQEEYRNTSKNRCLSPSCCYYCHAHCNCEQRSEYSATTNQATNLEKRPCCSTLEFLHSASGLDLDNLGTGEWNEENPNKQLRETVENSSQSSEPMADRVMPSSINSNNEKRYEEEKIQNERSAYNSNMESASDEEWAEDQESTDEYHSSTTSSEGYDDEEELYSFSHLSPCGSQHESFSGKQSNSETISPNTTYLEIRMAHQTQKRRRHGEGLFSRKSHKTRKEESKTGLENCKEVENQKVCMKLIYIKLNLI